MSRRARKDHPRADAILKFVVEFKQRHDGIAPSFVEIGAATGIKSRSLIPFYLDKLEAAGRIKLIRTPAGTMAARGIIIPGGSWIPPVERENNGRRN